ncbi:MAG: acyl carrier protein [Myxococcota bacterium]
MDRTKLLQMFRTTASEVAEQDFGEVGEEADIASMGVDSLAMLEVVGEMERQLEIQIPDDQLVGIQTVSQLLDLVEKRVQARG